MRRTGALVCVVALLMCGSAAVAGPVLKDGDMDNLNVGTNPDVGVPEGAWAWPQNYIDAGLAEVDPGQFTIVETASFDPSMQGNSLAMVSSDPSGAGFWHLPNLFNEIIDEEPGIIVNVAFDLWVPGEVGGGSIYVGGDHGGGGFSNVSDRGPQISWLGDGSILHSPSNESLGSYPFAEWQHILWEIDLTSDTYDMFWSVGDDPLELLAGGLEFRSGTQDFLDRFTYVHFSGLEADAVSFLDNVTIQVIPEPGTALILGLGVAGLVRRRRSTGAPLS